MRVRARFCLAIVALGATLSLAAWAPAVAQAAPAATTDSGFLSDVVAFLLGVAALGGAVAVVWRRARCSHCQRGGLGGLAKVTDYEDIAACADCRQRALLRQEVRLCWDCERLHARPADGKHLVLAGHAARGLRASGESAPEPPFTSLEVAEHDSGVFIEHSRNSDTG